MADSSSTINTLGIGRSGWRSNSVHGDGQFNHKAGADRLVFLDPDGSVMVFNDSADDGEAQPGAALLAGKRGSESALFRSLGYSIAAVGHADFERVPAGNPRRRT